MGSLVEAKCSCGYTANGSVGGLRCNYLDVCSFPFLCKDCDEMVRGNLYEYRNRCPACGGANMISYEAPELFKGSAKAQRVVSSGVTTYLALREGYFPVRLSRLDKIKRFFKPQDPARSEWRDAELKSDGYYCPKCETHNLGFELVGKID